MTERKFKICARCGKKIYLWHYVNGLPMCCDDRMCWQKQPTRRNKCLHKNRRRYGGGEK